LDRALGAHIARDAVQKALLDGERVEVHQEKFAMDSPDQEWLQYIGENGLAGITKDKAIRFNELEIQSALESNAAYFALSKGGLTGEQQAAAIVNALPSMRKALRRFALAMIGTFTATGVVTVRYADGKKLEKPITLK
jgi:hypothetical protein